MKLWDLKKKSMTKKSAASPFIIYGSLFYFSVQDLNKGQTWKAKQRLHFSLLVHAYTSKMFCLSMPILGILALEWGGPLWPQLCWQSTSWCMRHWWQKVRSATGGCWHPCACVPELLHTPWIEIDQVISRKHIYVYIYLYMCVCV